MTRLNTNTRTPTTMGTTSTYTPMTRPGLWASTVTGTAMSHCGMRMPTCPTFITRIRIN